ncbi:hypothetical protein LTR62_007784 [Meristemomyces frigidus]|uniref:Ketoreductase domain-containing protein n=1 Tax=Meristemomyces frigidus TaxID=1508187 RepID=A0AAN7TB98_9PEZI|nr:hypothetical protein LTR62_007784 [Meristemomyces frigidus]
MASNVPDEENFLLKAPRPVATYHRNTYERISPRHFDGKGKTVLVTGGASGIGLATAHAFAESGVARLVLLQRNTKTLEAAKKELTKAWPATNVLTYPISLTDYTKVEEILAELKFIDIVVLSAAMPHEDVPAAQISTAVMTNVFQVNVLTSFNLVNAYLSLPETSGHSKTIISLSTGAAHVILPNQVGYGPSKAACAQVMQHFAAERGPKDGVRIFNVHPGVIKTELSASTTSISLPWEDIKLPAHFFTWIAGPESDYLHGRFVWAQWDVDELNGLKERVAEDPSFLTIGLVQ